MASGHDLTFYAVVMNIVILALTIMNGKFSTTKLEEMSLSVTMELELASFTGHFYFSL